MRFIDLVLRDKKLPTGFWKAGECYGIRHLACELALVLVLVLPFATVDNAAVAVSA